MFDEWWTFFLFNLLTIGEACTPNSPKKENVKIHQILLMMTLTLRNKTYLLYTLLQSSLFPPKALLFPFWDMCSFPGIYIHALAPFSLLKTNISPENWCLEHGFFIRKNTSNFQVHKVQHVNFCRVWLCEPTIPPGQPYQRRQAESPIGLGWDWFMTQRVRRVSYLSDSIHECKYRLMYI